MKHVLINSNFELRTRLLLHGDVVVAVFVDCIENVVYVLAHLFLVLLVIRVCDNLAQHTNQHVKHHETATDKEQQEPNPDPRVQVKRVANHSKRIVET